MMTREDILRELELLPVWQLRKPVPQVTPAPKVQKVEQSKPEAVEQVQPKSENASLDKAQLVGAEPSTEVALPKFRMLLSADSDWLFVLSQPQDNENQEIETLLNNMIKAVDVKVVEDSHQATMENVAKHQPKVIVAMGEQAAQALLATQDNIESLRSKAHAYHSTALVVTYSPQHLLAHLPDKAKAWEDLCLAKLSVGSLATE